ncbi:MAG: hypothetical protein ACYC28_05430 [Longimicrobiales bacterium]
MGKASCRAAQLGVALRPELLVKQRDEPPNQLAPSVLVTTSGRSTIQP